MDEILYDFLMDLMRDLIVRKQYEELFRYRV